MATTAEISYASTKEVKHDTSKEEALKEIKQVEYVDARKQASVKQKLNQRVEAAKKNIGKQEYTGSKKSMSPESGFKGRFLKSPGKSKPFAGQPELGGTQKVVFRPRYVRKEVDYKSEVGPQSRDTDGLPQHFGNVPNWNRNSAIRMFANNPLPKFFGSGASGGLPRHFDNHIGVKKNLISSKLRKGVFG